MVCVRGEPRESVRDQRLVRGRRAPRMQRQAIGGQNRSRDVLSLSTKIRTVFGIDGRRCAAHGRSASPRIGADASL